MASFTIAKVTNQTQLPVNGYVRRGSKLLFMSTVSFTS